MDYQPGDTLPDIQTGERPDVLQALSFPDQRQDIQRAPTRPEWLHFALLRWKWLSLGIIGLAVTLSTAALVNSRAQQLEGTQTPIAPNQEALLSLSASDFEALNTQVGLQIDETYERLIDLEAVRFLAEAEKQTTDKTQPCYQQGIDCGLDQFEKDAVAVFKSGSTSLDRPQQLDALRRIAIVDRARTGLRIAPAPDEAITTLALQKRLEARQLTRKATAEGMAQDALPDSSGN